VVYLLLSPDGKVAKAVAASGPPDLAASAVEAATQWEFKPAGYYSFGPAEIEFSPSGVTI